MNFSENSRGFTPTNFSEKLPAPVTEGKRLGFLSSETLTLKKNSRGFTLVETFVAITVLAFALTGPLLIVSSGLVSARYARDEITAFYLASEATEYVRNIRDSNILSGLTGSSNWLSSLSLCMSGNTCVVDVPNNTVLAANFCGSASCPLRIQNNVYGYQSGAPSSIFTRTVNIVRENDNESSIFVTMSWKTEDLPVRVFKVKETILR